MDATPSSRSFAHWKAARAPLLHCSGQLFNRATGSQGIQTKNKNMKIVILGGTGLIGSKVVNLLRAGGHEVVAASPSRGINSITGEGLAETLTGPQVVPGQLPRLQWGR